MHSVRLALRSLSRGRLKTLFTIISVMLGVSLLVSINISADSLLFSINDAFNDKLGKNDIMVRDTKLSGFDYDASVSILSEIEGVKSFVPRKTAGFTYRLNVSSIEGDHCNFVAINASNPLEKQFGKSKIIDTLPGYNYTDFEDYLTLPGNVCVVNQQVADKHNLSVGQAVYVHSQNLVEAGQVWSLTSTWINYTIVAIINDLSETIHNVAPPIKPWHLRPLDRAIFISLECADLQFNIMKQNMSYFFIEADSTADIDQLTEHIVSTFNNTDGFSGDGFFGVNLKEMIIEDVKETATLLRIIFIFFSFMSLLVCSILVKNLMEMSLEEYMFEIGILRSMVSSRRMIFKLFHRRFLIISVLGSILELDLVYCFLVI